jgi:IS30 family transposase
MRRTLPRRTDLTALSVDQLKALVDRYNDTPRKCLAYRTPNEVFSRIVNVLHFNRESTFPPFAGMTSVRTTGRRDKEDRSALRPHAPAAA